MKAQNNFTVEDQDGNSTKTAVIARFSISLVYLKNIPNGQEIALRVLITNAYSGQEALGKGILNFDEEMKEFNLSNKVVVRLNEL
jgi:hypothetical protein